jgi:glycosyltransferase involved in cell wall biosynthesis
MNARKMKRLAVIPSDPLEAYSYRSDKYLQGYFNPLQMFDEVFVFSPLEDRECDKAGIKIIPSEPKEFRKRLTEHKIDIVRAYGSYWACDMACNNKVAGVPIVVSVHDTNAKLLHNSIIKADVALCVSEAVKKLVLTKFKRSDRVWILPNRVDLDVMRHHSEDDFHDFNNYYPFKYRILHVGRKSKEKNLDTLIKALKILGDEYCIIAVGSGNLEEYIKLADEEGVLHNCYFIESIKNEELARYYSWASCMCVPSRWEGFGIVFIEALACESIVVTSDIAPMNGYIKHEGNGLLIKDYENPKALAEIIRTACNDKSLRESLKQNARKSVERFEKHIIEKLEAQYYEEALNLNLCRSNWIGRVWNFLRSR